MGDAPKHLALQEFDVVRVVRLNRNDRPYDGTPSVRRPPRIGDIGTVVHAYDRENSAAPVIVEAVTTNGYTLWLADFFPHELELVPSRVRGDSGG
jgi:hypothetical protein